MSSTTPELFGRFDRVVFEDFEFSTDSANRPAHILAYCSRELGGSGGREMWLPTKDPAPLGPRDLLIAYQSGAELGCRARLGWSMPKNILCLFSEYCREVAGLDGVQYVRRGLLDALRVFGITHPFEADKDRLQKRALDPAPFTTEERGEMLSYCSADVTTTKKLFEKMLGAGCWKTPKELDQALFRGQFVGAQRIVEGHGIPIDAELWGTINKHRDDIRRGFIERLDSWGIYDNGVRKEAKFEELIRSLKTNWPKTATGKFRKDKETLKAMRDNHPAIATLYELDKTLVALREPSLQITAEGRSHPYTSPFRSKTGRNQPSTSRFIFGAPKWMRSLVKPPPGRAISYVDVKAEEFGIASLLSKDPAMWESYCSADVYLDFAHRAGLVPKGATKESHPESRKMAKAVVLGTQYGQGSRSIALNLGITEQKAEELLWYHHEVYKVFWKYHDVVQQMARFRGCAYSVLGWRMRVNARTSPRTIGNFPMQAGGAELMRAVTIELIKTGVMLVAQVHDAFVIEAGIESIDEETARTHQIISKVSRAIFGKPLKSEAKIVRYPDRYIDEDAGPMLRTLGEVLAGYGCTQLLIPEGPHPLCQTNRA